MTKLEFKMRFPEAAAQFFDWMRDEHGQDLNDDAIVERFALEFHVDDGVPRVSDDDSFSVVYVDGSWEETEPASDTGYCGACNGSGEGMYDGSRCGVCGGSGETYTGDDEPPDWD